MSDELFFVSRQILLVKIVEKIVCLSESSTHLVQFYYAFKAWLIGKSAALQISTPSQAGVMYIEKANTALMHIYI